MSIAYNDLGHLETLTPERNISYLTLGCLLPDNLWLLEVMLSCKGYANLTILKRPFKGSL